MRIALFETEDWEEAACDRLGVLHQITCTPGHLDLSTASGYGDAEIVSIFVGSLVDEAVLDRLPALKLVATRSTGLDHIDLSACERRGIMVCNVPDYGDATVAEHVFALLLAIVRNIVESVESTRRGVFSAAGKRGTELRGKVIAVVGTGRIGRRTIEIARGFGMTVLAYDVQPDMEVAARLGFSYGSLHEILEHADVVTLHVPSSAKTMALIDDDAFLAMKQGCILINTARGNLVDPEALVRALESGQLRAAGLDVLPRETLLRDEAELFRGLSPPGWSDLRTVVADNILLHHPNVVITPHNAYNTGEALRRIIDTTIGNIEAFTEGSPRNVVSASS